MNVISITSIICITLFGLFGSFALITKQGNKNANKLLGLFFILWALDFLDGLLMLEGFYLKHTEFALWGESLVFLYGPLLYYYTLHNTKNNIQITWKFFIHLIPFMLFLVVILISFHVLPKADKINILNTIINLKQPPEIYLLYVIIYVHFFCYLYLSKRHLYQTIKNLNNFHSHHDFKWLTKLLNSFLGILVISLATNILQFNQSQLYFEIALPILIIVIGLFVAATIINALNRPYIFSTDYSKIKYATSKLDNKEIEFIAKKITKALEKDKLYLNPELNLEDLAEEINFNSRMVSQVINTRFSKNFFDLINSYRINAATEKFKKNKDPKHTILEVMYEVGFNSKSSFNKQFKNRTGLTPTEFIKLN